MSSKKKRTPEETYKEMVDRLIKDEELSPKMARRKAAKIWNAENPDNPVTKWQEKRGK